jgi:hypothetical protein
MTARRPTSPPSSSQNTSIPFSPITPSSLREAHTVAGSSEDIRDTGTVEDRAASSSEPSPLHSPNVQPTPLDNDLLADDDALDGRTYGVADFGGKVVDEATALLRKPLEFIVGPSQPHPGICNHGTFRYGTKSSLSIQLLLLEN